MGRTTRRHGPSREQGMNKESQRRGWGPRAALCFERTMNNDHRQDLTRHGPKAWRIEDIDDIFRGSRPILKKKQYSVAWRTRERLNNKSYGKS